MDNRSGRAYHRELWTDPEHNTGYWKLAGLCNDADPAVFFPAKGRNDQIAIAKAYCDMCPVVRQCLDYALAVPPTDDWGVWGGTTQWERNEMRRAAGRPARARRRQPARGRLAAEAG